MSTRWSRSALPAAERDSVLETVTDTALVGATLAIAGRFLASVLVNAPGGFSGAPLGGLTTLGTILAGVALVLVGTRLPHASAGVGLFAVGVFGLLATVAPAASVPAAVAIVVGTATFGWQYGDDLGPAGGVATTLLFCGLAASLASGIGGLAAARGPASSVTLLGLGTLPAFVTTDRWSLVAAGVAGAVVVAVGTALPFVTGAMTLVGTGAVGASLPVVAVAVAGSVTAASAALRTRRWQLLAGIVLLALAGVPATLWRAVPFALGLVTLVAEVRAG